MDSYNFKCRAIDIEHSCCHKNGEEPEHSYELRDFIKDLLDVTEKLGFNGIIKSTKNSTQVDFDFDCHCLKRMSTKGWQSEPIDNLGKLRNIPNIQPDGILSKTRTSKISVSVEIEKSNKKTIWFDLIKFMMLITHGIAHFGVLIVPRNYAHRNGVWNLFDEARYYKYCLSEFADVDEELLSKIAIIGYTQQAHTFDNWVTLDSSIIKNIKEQAKKYFQKK